MASGLNFAYSVTALTGSHVPHAFVASYHHALTVGFISMMILGMSMRLVPVFISALNKQPRLGALLFILVNLGCALRVVSESLAFTLGGAFYTLMGLSGLIEVCGLAIYGIALWRALDEPSYGQSAPQQGLLRPSPRGTIRPHV